MTDLTELIERVRNASGPDREIDATIAVHCAGFFELPPRWEGGPVGYGYIDAEGTPIHPGHGGDQLVRHYTASLDAITALIEKRLPGWVYNVGGCQPDFLTDRDKPFGAEIMGPVSWRVLEREVGEEPVFDHHSASAPTAPLALCLAVLLAIQENSRD